MNRLPRKIYRYAPGAWRKATASNSQGNCVEWRFVASGVEVRDSKFARRGEVSPVLEFTHEEWRAFIGACKLGEADLNTSFISTDWSRVKVK